MGQIKFPGVSTVSATRARDHAACLGRLSRVAGKPSGWPLRKKREPPRKSSEEGFVVMVTAGLVKLLIIYDGNLLDTRATLL
jgi:hypothetical protein